MSASGESATRRKLPIGIQTFREIREDDCYYVDKTALIRQLTEGGKHYFLSRPRRFGKSLLLDTIKELFEGNEALLSAFDVDEMAVEALLFQTGYLTITGEDASNGLPQYQLGYPNLEVRQSLNERLLMALLPDASRRLAQKASLRKLLAANDFEGLEALLRAVFAAIPHQWHTRNDIREYEGYYASVVYSYFAAQGLDLVAEDSASGGRADMTVRCNGGLYLFEFKLTDRGAQGRALSQIKERGYADKYRHLKAPIHLIGLEFSEAERNIAAFEVERAA